MDKIYRISATLDKKGFRFEIKPFKAIKQKWSIFLERRDETKEIHPDDLMVIDIANNTTNENKNVRIWAYCEDGKQGELKEMIIRKIQVMLNSQKETIVALLVQTKNTHTKYL